MHHVPHLPLHVLITRLILSIVLCGVIGFERELRETAAGLRTHIMVGLGSALFTIASAYGFLSLGEAADPTRIAAQIVSGIGFLGAGAIIRNGLEVRGLTTAATLWSVAAIGICTGAGLYAAAVVATGLIAIGLGPAYHFERIVIARLRRRPSECILDIELSSDGRAAAVLGCLEQRHILAYRVHHEATDEKRSLRIECELPSHASVTEIAEDVTALPDVRNVSWDT